MNRTRTKRTKKATDPAGAGWKAVCGALLISIGIGAGAILLASLAAFLTPDPGQMIRPFAICVAALTYLGAGAVAAKFRPEAPLAAGSVNGLILSALSLALSLLFHQTATALPLYATALLHAGMILLSLFGAYLYVWKKSRPAKKKKRKHT